MAVEHHDKAEDAELVIYDNQNLKAWVSADAPLDVAKWR